MKRYVIDSIKDIQLFFTDIHYRTQKPFAPEDDLAVVTDSSGTTVFQKRKLHILMI